MKAVLDTNLLVSALIVPVGKPARILAHMEHRPDFELLTSEAIQAELTRVLHYPHIQKRYKLTEDTIEGFLRRVRTSSTMVAVEAVVSVVDEDPDDNMVLACGVDGKANYTISGDPHLLRLGEYQGMRILSPSTFLSMLEAESETDEL